MNKFLLALSLVSLYYAVSLSIRFGDYITEVNHMVPQIVANSYAAGCKLNTARRDCNARAKTFSRYSVNVEVVK